MGVALNALHYFNVCASNAFGTPRIFWGKQMKVERPAIQTKRQGSLSTARDSTLPSWQSYVVAGYKPPLRSRIAGNKSVHDFYKHVEHGCNMLNSCSILKIHTFPSKQACTSLREALHFLKKRTRCFERDCGKVHAAISMLARCKYISIVLFLNYLSS